MYGQIIDYKYKFDESQARFEAIFNLTSAPSKIISSDLRIMKVNPALTELLGYSRDELIGTRILNYASTEDVWHWRNLQRAMWDQGRPNFKLDACLRKKDGSLTWVHVTTFRFEEDGHVYAYSMLDDFTHEKKIDQSELRLSMALRNSKMAVLELDLANRSIVRSDGFNDLLGYEANSYWTEERLIALFLPEYASQLRDLLLMISPGQSFNFQGRIKTTDGLIKWVDFHGHAERTPNVINGELLGTLRDITGNKLAEDEKDNFISLASHVLKTPLTTLNGALQLLQRMKGPPSKNWPTLIELATKSMGKIKSLVNDLLNASNINKGQLQLVMTRFNLSKAIHECCLSITGVGAYHITYESSGDVEVYADFERVQRVIIILVGNAIKYAPKSKDILVRVSKKDEYARVSVIDSGSGIATERIPHLFKRYETADKHCGEYSGLGLGLYISSEIIRRHGGEIGVESYLGTGSRFWFTLPLK